MQLQYYKDRLEYYATFPMVEIYYGKITNIQNAEVNA